EAAADVLAVAHALGAPSFDLVAHSMSTLVALQVAQQSPERVRRLVLVTPTPPTGFSYDAATHAALREVALGADDRRTKALAYMLAGSLPAGWLRFKVAQWRETSTPEAVAGYLSMFGVRGLPDTATRIKCPVLAITGERDA